MASFTSKRDLYKSAPYFILYLFHSFTFIILHIEKRTHIKLAIKEKEVHFLKSEVFFITFNNQLLKHQLCLNSIGPATLQGLTDFK